MLFDRINMLIVVLFATIPTGCAEQWNTQYAFPNDDKWDKLCVGMTEQEIVQCVGQPIEKQIFMHEGGTITHTYLIYSVPKKPTEKYYQYKVILSATNRLIDIHPRSESLGYFR